MVSRRKFLTSSAGVAALASLPISLRWSVAGAMGLAPGLSDPAIQPKFAYPVPDALAPGFIFKPNKRTGEYTVRIQQATQTTGIIRSNGKMARTPVWGYGDPKDGIYTWPGRTFQVKSGADETVVNWINGLNPRALENSGGGHLLPVDTSLHWCYSLDGYTDYSIAKNGVPLITHLHGGHSDFQFDGNPEFFYSPEGPDMVVGPQWQNVSGGFTTKFRYDNNVPAGNLWYHDHALGLTRLNVYAGLAGFYFVRDDIDTGEEDNPLGLPAWPYEKAYAIQDRMFRNTGELFYSAFPGDPFYDDFITGEGAVLPADLFPGGGATALAEFFGDHMLVNGVIWPFEAVEPRNYRLHLLNGTDSRFMVIRFRKVPAGATELPIYDPTDPHALLPFHVIGSDQGLASAATLVDTLVFEPGSRYDIVIDFSQVAPGSRVIMENIGGDAPFGGEFGDALDADDFFPDRQTDRVMAFDVVVPLPKKSYDAFDPNNISSYSGNENSHDRTRKVALFEGMDEFGRLQPLLGTAEPTLDAAGNMVSGAIAWHSPVTENPTVGNTEIWEIYNATGDAHPVHLHLVNFEVLGRQEFTANVVGQPLVQHNGETGSGFRLDNIALGDSVTLGPADGYVENAPKDMVTALPDQVTRIKATFDKPGRYVWHCHILSHEDHEMMRVLEVGSGD